MTGKLLVVDDSATDRMIIKNMLYGYEVLTAQDGREAMRLLETNLDVDIIILDLNMPVMNGFEVLEAVKALDQNKKIRSIILTNYDELDNEIKGLQAGAVDFIRKPINLESLRLRIGIHLELLEIQKLYEQTLFDRNLTLDTLLDQAPIGIALSHDARPIDGGSEEVVFNQAYERITGRSREALIHLGWAKITHPDDLEKEMELYRDFLAGKIENYSIEKRYVRPDGSAVWVDTIVAQLNLKNKASAFNHICLVQDINKRKMIESALVESERSKSVLLANLPGIAFRCDYDPNWTMRFISEGCFELTGYRPENLVDNRDLSFNDLIVPEYQESLWKEWTRTLAEKNPFKCEYEIITATGQHKWLLEMGQGVFDESGNVKALEGIIIDITDRKVQEIQLRHISEIDSLTKLHNRRFLENILYKDAQSKAKGMRAVVMVSLQTINSISLTYGYSFCEQIIVELTQSLAGLSNEHRSLFHVSFERYAFYITQYRDENELEALCRMIIERIDAIQILRTVGCGIGIFTFDFSESTAENIIKNASTAAEKMDREQLYGYQFFNHEMENAVQREAAVKEALIRMVDGSPEERLYLRYQPILNLKTNCVEGFEALARMHSDTLGTVSPLEFIGIAEETQMIIAVGKNVLELTCAFQKRLHTLGFENIRIYMNVSAVQLLRSEFLEDFLHVLKTYDLHPQNFGLEVTESVFTSNFNVINEKLEKLMKSGVRTSIDDFGTGYSTLSRERI